MECFVINKFKSVVGFGYAQSELIPASIMMAYHCSPHSRSGAHVENWLVRRAVV